MLIKKLLREFIGMYYTLKIKKQCKSYKVPLKVNGRSSVTNKTILGSNVNMNGLIIGGCGEVKIGNNFHSGIDCLFITQNHNYEGNSIPYDSTYTCKDIIIENNVWLGSKVIILGGVSIGEGAIIQAGAVVSKSIPKYAIAGGNPAKVFKYRDIEHYERLKKEGKFH